MHYFSSSLNIPVNSIVCVHKKQSNLSLCFAYGLREFLQFVFIKERDLNAFSLISGYIFSSKHRNYKILYSNWNLKVLFHTNQFDIPSTHNHLTCFLNCRKVYFPSRKISTKPKLLH